MKKLSFAGAWCPCTACAARKDVNAVEDNFILAFVSLYE